MSKLGTVQVDIEPRLDQQKAKAGFTKAAKLASGAFVAAFAAKKAFDIGAQAINAAEEYGTLVGGVTNLVEKQQAALGDSATLTTDHLVSQADAIERLTGISDEQILTAQRQLLSFQSLQNAGTGMDAIYDRTTKALTDMVASGALSDFNSGAIQLGKALADPARGMTALRRSGVVFTAQQEEQIKAMQESGDLLGAQKVILDELEKVYGGTAESQRNATDVIKNAWQDIQVKIGDVLLPLLENLATWIADTMIPTLEKWWPAIQQTAEALGDGFTKAWQTVRPIFDAIGRAISAVRGIFQRDGDQITGTAQGIFDKVGPIFRQLADAIGAAIELISAILDKQIALWTWLWDNFGDTILGVVRNTFDTITGVISGALDIITGILDVVTGLLTGDWSKAWAGARKVVSGAFKVVKAIIRGAIRNVVTIVGGLGGKLLRALAGVPGKLYDLGRDLIAGMIDGITSMARRLADSVKDTVMAPVNWVKDKLGIGSPSRLFRDYGRWMSEGMRLGLGDQQRHLDRAVYQMVPSRIGSAPARFPTTATTGAATTGGGVHIEINNPTSESTNAGIQRGLAVARLMGA